MQRADSSLIPGVARTPTGGRFLPPAPEPHGTNIRMRAGTLQMNGRSYNLEHAQDSIKFADVALISPY